MPSLGIVFVVLCSVVDVLNCLGSWNIDRIYGQVLLGWWFDVWRKSMSNGMCNVVITETSNGHVRCPHDHSINRQGILPHRANIAIIVSPFPIQWKRCGISSVIWGGLTS